MPLEIERIHVKALVNPRLLMYTSRSMGTKAMMARMMAYDFQIFILIAHNRRREGCPGAERVIEEGEVIIIQRGISTERVEDQRGGYGMML
jgi:hypothetical protein